MSKKKGRSATSGQATPGDTTGEQDVMPDVTDELVADADEPTDAVESAAEKASEKAPEQPKRKRDGAPAKAEKAKGEVHLITGFPGFIGRRLIERLFQSDETCRAVLLVQPHMVSVAQQSLSDLDIRLPGLMARCDVVTGDIAQPALGLDNEAHARWTREVTQVWHLAAIYDLSVKPQVAYRVNVVGTANVLDFCEACQGHRFSQLNYVSTCYVSGDRKGLVLESELDNAQGHKNHYESTKFWAEVEVQRRWSRIPTAIFRPGVVVGDSKTGATDKYDGPYFFVRFLMRLPDWLPMVYVGKGDALVNLVPVDYVVDAMVAISRKEGAVGKAYQLADPNPMRAGDLIDLFLKVLGRRPAIGRIPDTLLNHLLKIRQMRRLTGMPREIVDYMNHPARYDVTNALEALEGTGVRCPHFSTYARTLLDYLRRNPQKEFLDHRVL